MKSTLIIALLFSSTAFAQQDELRYEISVLKRLLEVESRIYQCTDLTSLVDGRGVLELHDGERISIDVADGESRTFTPLQSSTNIDYFQQMSRVVDKIMTRIEQLERYIIREDTKLYENIKRVDSRIDKIPTTSRVEYVQISSPTPYQPPQKVVTPEEQAKIDRAVEARINKGEH